MKNDPRDCVERVLHAEKEFVFVGQFMRDTRRKAICVVRKNGLELEYPYVQCVSDDEEIRLEILTGGMDEVRWVDGTMMDAMRSGLCSLIWRVK